MIGGGDVLLRELMRRIDARDQAASQGFDTEDLDYEVKGARSALRDYLQRLEVGYARLSRTAKLLAMYRLAGEDGVSPDVRGETFQTAKTLLGEKGTRLTMRHVMVPQHDTGGYDDAVND